MRAFLSAVLAAVLVSACGGKREGPPLVPAKTVVLTFDDAVENHLTTVVPILEELGFGATFFVTPRFREDGRKGYLDWEGIARLNRRGFEVGNHSFGHVGFNYPECYRHLRWDLSLIEQALQHFEVPKPISFAWPGDGFGPEALKILASSGYLFARRGRAPDVALGWDPVPGPVYDPRRNHPLLVPTTVAAGARWTSDDVRKVLALAVEGKAVVFQFHGIPDPMNAEVSVTPEAFREWMRLLKSGGYRVVALRDLEPYVDWSSLPDDPLAKQSWPDPAKFPYPLHAKNAGR